MARVPPGISALVQQPAAQGHRGPFPSQEGPEYEKEDESPASEEFLGRELTGVTISSETPLIQERTFNEPEPFIPPSLTPQPRMHGSVIPAAATSLQDFLGTLAVVEPNPPLSGPPSLEDVRWLLERRRVNSALTLLKREDAPKSAEAMHLELRCLVSLEKWTEAAEVVAQLLLLLGDEVPLEVRLVSAQLPFRLSRASANSALCRLQDLASSFREARGTGFQPGDPPPARFHRTLLQVMSHISIIAGHGKMVAAELRAHLEAAKQGRLQGLGAPELASVLGRHLLALGDLNGAQAAFTGSSDELQALLDQGLLASSRGLHQDARTFFAKASAVAAVTPNAALDEVVAAENNLAVSRLYTDELKEAINGLEAFIRRDPARHLVHTIGFNLSALYEFTKDTSKRRALLVDVAKTFKLEDLDLKALEAPS